MLALQKLGVVNRMKSAVYVGAADIARYYEMS